MKFAPLTEDLARYVSNQHSNANDPLLKELREETKLFGDDAVMQLPDNQSTLMTMLVKMIGATSALEIGTFTGHSSICIARGLPDNGRLTCFDLSREWTDVARKYWQKAGLAERITLVIGDALESLNALDSDDVFDFVHIDAEKVYYEQYYELVLPHVRPNGLIVFDNMLMGGGVIDPNRSPRVQAVYELNQKLADDPRIDNVLVPICDGIQICRKV